MQDSFSSFGIVVKGWFASEIHRGFQHIADTPTKSEDDLGIATPDLVLPSLSNTRLAIEGEGFLGQYAPLSQASLEDKLTLE